MNNLLSKFELKSFIVCRDYEDEIVGIFTSAAEAAEDFFATEDEILEAIETKEWQTGSGYWSGETVLVEARQQSQSTHAKRQRKNLSISNEERGRHRHEKTSVAVVQLDPDNMSLIARFDSMYSAQCSTGARNISKCCKGEAKSSGGFRWMFEDEYEALIGEPTPTSSDELENLLEYDLM